MESGANDRFRVKTATKWLEARQLQLSLGLQNPCLSVFIRGFGLIRQRPVLGFRRQPDQHEAGAINERNRRAGPGVTATVRGNQLSLRQRSARRENSAEVD